MASSSPPIDTLGIAIILSPSCASKSTGLIERGNRILEEVTAKGGHVWDEELHKAIKTMDSQCGLWRTELKGLQPSLNPSARLMYDLSVGPQESLEDG